MTSGSLKNGNPEIFFGILLYFSHETVDVGQEGIYGFVDLSPFEKPSDASIRILDLVKQRPE